MIRIFAILLGAATVSHAEARDLILEVHGWDAKTAKTISGWFADSGKIRAMEKSDDDAAPVRKLVASAKEYLRSKFPEPIDSPSDEEDPFQQGGPVRNQAKVKSWVFEEMVVKPLDLGRVRGTLISWNPEPSGLFYYKLIFRVEFEGSPVTQRKSVILLPNSEVIPFRKIDTTLEEKKQIVWWERHMGHITHEEKEKLIQSFTRSRNGTNKAEQASEGGS